MHSLRNQAVHYTETGSLYIRSFGLRDLPHSWTLGTDLAGSNPVTLDTMEDFTETKT